MPLRLSLLLTLSLLFPCLPQTNAAESRFGLSDKFGGSTPKAATVHKSRNSQRHHTDRDRDRNDRERDRRERDRRDRDDWDRDDRDRGPRVVGRRDPIREFAPTLKKNPQKDGEKGAAAKQLKQAETQSLGLRTHSSTKPTQENVPIRVVGTVGRSTIQRGDNVVQAYYLDSSVGRVPISAESFARGGVKIDNMSELLERRVRLTGRGFFADEARQQPRFASISKIEYERSSDSAQ
jgi:biotin carboxyl carrier protein